MWGLLLLVFAVYKTVQSVAPGALDPALWLLGAVLALGVILVVAGIAAATRHAESSPDGD
ncbi:hypothetical protein JF66_15115 [Cryobacterium sp. MLB-32]|nr:hypothetical protein JF66_15115 [Cryobacterium sp. MLB-32]